jgi:peptidoglycan hydrolase-like protein with peptidoglycan-binding domain
VIVLALAATACGGDDDATAEDSTTTTAPAATTTAPPATTQPPTTTAPTTTAPTTTEPSSPATVLVAAIQIQLGILGYYDGDSDGIYGPMTVDAVTAFQTDAGITADGQYGPETYAALAAALEADPDFVETLQEDLTELGLYSGAIDGVYGSGTERAVTQLQEECELEPEPDGRFTPLTHVCLLMAQGKA